MLHQGQVLWDIAGEQRRGLGVDDLLRRFVASQGETLADDSLLLS